MGESRAIRLLACTPDVVPDVDGDNGNRMILGENHSEAVVEPIILKLDPFLRTCKFDTESGHQNGSRNTKHLIWGGCG